MRPEPGEQFSLVLKWYDFEEEIKKLFLVTPDPIQLYCYSTGNFCTGNYWYRFSYPNCMYVIYIYFA